MHVCMSRARPLKVRMMCARTRALYTPARPPRPWQRRAGDLPRCIPPPLSLRAECCEDVHFDVLRIVQYSAHTLHMQGQIRALWRAHTHVHFHTARSHTARMPTARMHAQVSLASGTHGTCTRLLRLRRACTSSCACAVHVCDAARSQRAAPARVRVHV